MTYSRPTLDNLDNTSINRLFGKKLDVFFSEGVFDITDLPQTSEALKTLYTGGQAKFVPFGRLAADAGQIQIEAVTEEIHKQTVHLRDAIVLTMNSLEAGVEVLDYLKSDEGKGNLTFLFVPADEVEQELPNAYVIVSGIKINHSPKFFIDGSFARIQIAARKEVNNYLTSLFFDEQVESSPGL